MTTTRYCLIMQLNGGYGIARLKKDVPELIKIINDISKKECEQVCRSKDGTLFGYFLKTDKNINIIRSSLSSSTHSLEGDSFIVFEIGQAFTGEGFTRAWTWLQHH